MTCGCKMSNVSERCLTDRVDHVVHEFVYQGAFEPSLPSVPHDFSVIS